MSSMRKSLLGNGLLTPRSIQKTLPFSGKKGCPSEPKTRAFLHVPRKPLPETPPSEGIEGGGQLRKQRLDRRCAPGSTEGSHKARTTAGTRLEQVR